MEAVSDLVTSILGSATKALSACGISLALLAVDKELLVKLLEKTKYAFQKDGQIIRVNGKFVIVGDLHGHVLDLARIVQKYGLPPKTKYIFLGDLVDRGEFGIEVTTIIYAWKVLYPESVYIIRGNHEFDAICKEGGFYKEVMTAFNDTNIFEKYCETFSFTPLLCVLNEIFLCVHGGIGPDFKQITDVKKIKYPIRELNGGLIDEILWSDPLESIDDFEVSQRGTGYFYGDVSTSQFLDNNNLKAIIRGHTPVKSGVEVMFNDHIYTVHSASWINMKECNKSGCIVVDEDNMIDEETFEPLKHPRKCATERRLRMSASTPFFKTGQCAMSPGSMICRRPSMGKNQTNVIFG